MAYKARLSSTAGKDGAERWGTRLAYLVCL